MTWYNISIGVNLWNPTQYADNKDLIQYLADLLNGEAGDVDLSYMRIDVENDLLHFADGANSIHLGNNGT